MQGRRVRILVCATGDSESSTCFGECEVSQLMKTTNSSTASGFQTPDDRVVNRSTETLLTRNNQQTRVVAKSES